MSCLTEETVVAFADGRLGGEPLSQAEIHIVSCVSCQDLVMAALGSATRSGQAAPAPLPGGSLRRGLAIGRYTVLELTGRGGMGEVYAAYDAELDRKVALKLLRARGHSNDAQADARLLREARAMARVSHPNVVTVHDVGTFGGRVFVAMEFIEGVTLKEWLASAPRSRSEILAAFTMAGRGLAAAHAVGLVHRDFKPHNVMMAADGTARVMDFGLVAPVGELDDEASAAQPDGSAAAPELHLTRTGELLGTPLYMAPEQFKGERTDARTDQFGFCVSLHQALYDVPPFGDVELKALIAEVLQGRVRPAPGGSSVPASLRGILLRGLAVAPDARWPSMNALVAALERDLAHKRHRWALGGGAVGLAALAVVALAGRSSRSAAVCRGGPTRIVGVWESEGASKAERPRREAARRAFLATGASDIWERVAPILDRYASGWIAMFGDTCEATEVRHEQSAAVLDLRMTCLDQRRAALVALTDVLQTADRGVVAKAVDAANALPALDRCADLAWLRAPVARPRDAATSARVDAVRRRAAVAKALNDTGKPQEALPKIKALIEEARVIGYEPLLAELLDARVHFQLVGTFLPESVPIAEEAVNVGLASGRDDVAADAATQLVATLGYYQARPEEGWRWSRLARALLNRVQGRHELTDAWLLQNEALVHMAENRLSIALQKVNESVALKRKALGSQHPDVGMSLSLIAEVLHRLGRDSEALSINAEALRIVSKAYGAATTETCVVLANRGEYMVRDQPEESLAVSEKATTCWEGQVGPDHQFVGYSLTAMGRALVASRHPRPVEAVRVLERALRIREAHEPDQKLVAETREALAKARLLRSSR